MQRILIIEDEKPLREAFRFLLSGEHYEVLVAENGRMGLSLLKKCKPDLILLDMLMPLMDGLGFLRKARLPEQYPGVKVIMLSNLSDAITFEAAAMYGVTTSVLKADLSPDELVAIVKKVLSDGP